MLSTMERSTDQILGYTISGNMTKADYQTLIPAMSAVIEAQGSVSVLFDMTDSTVEIGDVSPATPVFSTVGSVGQPRVGNVDLGNVCFGPPTRTGEGIPAVAPLR